MSDQYDFEVPGLNPNAPAFVPRDALEGNGEVKQTTKSTADSRLADSRLAKEYLQPVSCHIQVRNAPIEYPKLTYDIFKCFPQNITLPPPGCTFDQHLRESIMKEYDCARNIIPPELFQYMIDSRMINIKK